MAREYKHEKVSQQDLNSVKFDRGGKSMVVCGSDNKVRILNDELECKKILSGHEDSVLDVCFE